MTCSKANTDVQTEEETEAMKKTHENVKEENSWEGILGKLGKKECGLAKETKMSTVKLRR